MTITLDTGALIGLERSSGRVLALLDLVSRRQEPVLVPAGVVAQAWRHPRQVRLARLLSSRDVSVVPLDDPAARAVGVLLARSRTSDVVDGHVVVVALTSHSPVISSDPDDLRHLDDRVQVHVV